MCAWQGESARSSSIGSRLDLVGQLVDSRIRVKGSRLCGGGPGALSLAEGVWPPSGASRPKA
eukprot:2636770-Alexandrium_andersonii.AAC.1